MKTTIGICIFMTAACCASSSTKKTSSGADGAPSGGILTPFEQPIDTIAMNRDIAKLGRLFSEIVDNANTFGSGWKNLKLAPEAFALMKRLPLRVEGELTPYTRIVLLNKMLGCVPERDCARFVQEVRAYQLSMFPLVAAEDLTEDMDIDGYNGPADSYVRTFTVGQLQEATQRTTDYLNPNISMQEWCRKYDVMLKFDEIERSEQWERHIYEVEEKVAEKLKGVPHRMGYCFEYWSVKTAVLARHGIEWRSPSIMNPRVMFD